MQPSGSSEPTKRSLVFNDRRSVGDVGGQVSPGRGSGGLGGLTSLLVETRMQDPVTVSPTTEEEPTVQDASKRMSSLRVTGAKVTSRGMSTPGRMKPLAGLMVRPPADLSVFQQKLMRMQRKQQIKKTTKKTAEML